MNMIEVSKPGKLIDRNLRATLWLKTSKKSCKLKKDQTDLAFQKRCNATLLTSLSKVMKELGRKVISVNSDLFTKSKSDAVVKISCKFKQIWVFQKRCYATLLTSLSKVIKELGRKVIFVNSDFSRSFILPGYQLSTSYNKLNAEIEETRQRKELH